MADTYIPHTTTEGERWDQLAYRYYGSAYRYDPIVRANPHVPLTLALPAGLELRIPLLDVTAAKQDLPPWMR
ncbi:tail protein X [Metapseudomonas otitidis]|uniref:tail protein X n=1 Tax=Metapseudomonas otitidis TaxID=319939 RepID=UPI0013F6394D|nr:tail protein X [Pseudomonas otitidis]MDG9783714.1 tail protein X [Pseudomonas otitidis]